MITVRNTRAAESPADAPRKEDGTAYRFEMIMPGGSLRAYADTHGQLLEILAPGYLEAPGPLAQMKARLNLALSAQVHVQAQLVDPEGLEQCSADERDALLSSRATPPAPESWSAPIPLILVATFYQPIGRIPLPEATEPGEVWMIDPASEAGLLVDLARVGWINLAEAASPADPEEAQRG